MPTRKLVIKEAYHKQWYTFYLAEMIFGSNPLCFRSTKNYSKGNEKEFKALKDKCNFCGEIGQDEKCYKKAGSFLKKPISTRGGIRKLHTFGAVTEPDFWDEAGNTMYNAHILPTSKG